MRKSLVAVMHVHAKLSADFLINITLSS